MADPQVTYVVEQADEGIRLDRWFKRHYPDLPHAMLEKYLRKGLVRLDGKKAAASVRVEAGQALSCPQMKQLAAPKAPPRALRAQAGHADERETVQAWVLYKDADVLVINKPFGLAVQGGSRIARSLDDMLDALTFEAGGRPKLVHRLDRDTSGVLVLARHAKAASALAAAFAGKKDGKTIEKTYWALVHGAPLQRMGVIDLPLLKAVKGESSHEVVGVDAQDGKYAVTEYRIVESLVRKFAWMELKPLTGRTHQLRVHMQQIGSPIVGDGKYGGRTELARELGVANKLHLHARRIVIPANVTGKAIDVSAPLPEHMRRSFVALGLNAPKK